MNLSFLNPVNWIKSGIANAADAEIDRALTSKNLEVYGRNGVNYLIQLSESKVDDDKLEQIANDLVYAGESLAELGRSIHPKGESGRKLSESEVAALNARVKVLFGDVIHECDLAALRDQAKALVRKVLAVFIVCLMFCGCANRGCKVTVSSASVTSIGDINWEEYKIPILSVYTGPRLTVWVNKDYLALSKVKGNGSVTNDTSALGIYTDHAGKSASVEMEFKPATNLVTTAKSVVE